MEGWVKLHRKILKWEWYEDINVARLFMHLLLTCNYEEKQWKGIVIEKGQRVFGIDKLSKETGLTIQQTRTALDKLKSTSNITIKSTNRFSIVTVNSWVFHQSIDADVTSEVTSTATSNQQTNNTPPNKQITTTKEVKNKEVKKERKSAREEKSLIPPEYEFLFTEGKEPFAVAGKGLRLTDDWELCQEWGEWAESNSGLANGDVVKEAEKFKRYYLSLDCKQPIRRDWVATWRN